MPLPPPTFSDGYALTTSHEVSRTVFNSILGDIKTRIAALQSVVVAYEAIEAAGIAASIAVITDSITPQLEALAGEMSAIQALIVVAEGQLLALQNAGVDAENITIGDDVGLGSGLNLEEALIALKAYADAVGDALDTAKVSVADKASQVEARAGTDNAKWMTPLRVREQRLLRAVVKAANYTAVAADFGLEISCSGTFTLSLTAAATLGDGWFVWVRNAGSGVITIDPNAAETIDGVATITMASGEAIRVSTDGTLFRTTGRAKHAMELIGGVRSGAGLSAIDWTSLDATYETFRLDIWSYEAASGTPRLELAMSTNNGTTVETFKYSGVRTITGNGSGFSSDGTGNIALTGFVSGGDIKLHSVVNIRRPKTSGFAYVNYATQHLDQSDPAKINSFFGVAQSSSAAVINCLRLKPASGNFAAIFAQLYGIKTA